MHSITTFLSLQEQEQCERVWRKKHTTIVVVHGILWNVNGIGMHATTSGAEKKTVEIEKNQEKKARKKGIEKKWQRLNDRTIF